MYDGPFPITKEENQILKDRGLATVSQLFDTEEPRSLDRQVAFILPRNLQIKIDNIVINIKRKLMEFRNAPLHRNSAESILQEKQVKLSQLIKTADRRKQEDTWLVAPSRQNRTKDSIPVPDIDTYNKLTSRIISEAFLSNKKLLTSPS